MTNFRWPRVFVACILALTIATPARALPRWMTWIDELSGPGPFHGYLFSAEVLCVGTPTPAELKWMKDRLLAPPPKDPKSAEALATAEKHFGALAYIRLCAPDRENNAVALVLEAGRWNDKRRHAKDDNDITRLSNTQLIAYFPLHRVLGPCVEPDRVTRAIELGAGVGVFRFTGPTVRDKEWWRGAIPLRVRVIPSEFFYKQNRSQKDPFDTQYVSRIRRFLQPLQIRAGFDFIPGQMDFSTAFNSERLDHTRANELNPTASFQYDFGVLAWSFIRWKTFGHGSSSTSAQ